MTRWKLRFTTFQVDLRWWLLAIAMAAVAVRLGIWQLDRADQKIALQDAYYDRIALNPVPCARAVGEPRPAYVRVRLDGRFETGREYLLDNRTSDATAGYEVLTRFRCTDGTLFLVNRGWIPGGSSRDRLPVWTTPSEPVRLTGFVYVPTGLPPLIDQDDWPVAWPEAGPKRIGYLDPERLHTEGPPEQFRYPVYVDAAGPGVFKPNYAVESVSPDKHWGYAVQWFAIAAAILAYLGYRSISRT
jgi:cytochrome oxidase assembly protein ShyY1